MMTVIVSEWHNDPDDNATRHNDLVMMLRV
jgi:hypothetical protein